MRNGYISGQVFLEAEDVVPRAEGVVHPEGTLPVVDLNVPFSGFRSWESVNGDNWVLVKIQKPLTLANYVTCFGQDGPLDDC